MDEAQARAVLQIIIINANDRRDGYLTESYASLLGRAGALVGAHLEGVSEKRARSVMERAHRAAVGRGLSLPLIEPAEAAAVVLRAASKPAARTSK